MPSQQADLLIIASFHFNSIQQPAWSELHGVLGKMVRPPAGRKLKKKGSASQSNVASVQIKSEMIENYVHCNPLDTLVCVCCCAGGILTRSTSKVVGAGNADDDVPALKLVGG